MDASRAGTLPLCFSLRQLEYGSCNLDACVAVLVLFLNSLKHCQSFEMFVKTNPAHFGLKNIERVPYTSVVIGQHVVWVNGCGKI